jgi:hypothetical protein
MLALTLAFSFHLDALGNAESPGSDAYSRALLCQLHSFTVTGHTAAGKSTGVE